MIKTQILWWKTTTKCQKKYIKVVTFFLFTSHTDPWCNMLQTWQRWRKYIDVILSDEHTLKVWVWEIVDVVNHVFSYLFIFLIIKWGGANRQGGGLILIKIGGSNKMILRVKNLKKWIYLPTTVRHGKVINPSNSVDSNTATILVLWWRIISLMSFF